MTPAEVARAAELLQARSSLDSALDETTGVVEVRLTGASNGGYIRLAQGFDKRLQQAGWEAVQRLRDELTKQLNELGVFDPNPVVGPEAAPGSGTWPR